MSRIKGLRSPVRAAAVVAVAGLALTGCSGNGTTGAAANASPASAVATGGEASQPVQIGSYNPANASDATFYGSVLTGANVATAGGPTMAGNKGGSAVALVSIQGDEVSFAFTWKGIDTPTSGHIHAGAKGVNGGVKINFFSKKLPDGSSSVIGTTKVSDEQTLASLRSNPQQYYFNLHTAEFPDGAIRGQVYALPGKVDLKDALLRTSLNPVVNGAQVYACTKQPGGTYAFTQDNVDATLQGGIKHSFVNPGPAGPPQWVAPDKSAVTGKALQKIQNGDKNIPELVLQATQEGKAGGLLSATQYVLRLNTVGGVAPAGTCNPQTQPKAQSPYTADYLFVG
jgi:hypothetical protein